MLAVRHRRARKIGALFLLAVLCHPLAWSGHRHPAGDLGVSQSGCAVCTATAHAPALSPPAPPLLALRLFGSVPTPLETAAALPAEFPAWSPRGPPAASHTPVV
jgi:hypothetical protein